MMTNKIRLFVYVLVFFSFHLDAQDSPRKGLVLSDSYASQERPGSYYDQHDSLMYYNFSLNFYEQHFMTEAIEEIERALIKYPYGIYYYIYGNYLTEIEDYDNAEKAYKKAIVRFEYEFNYRYEVFRYFPSSTGADELFFSHDSNGAVREVYFAYYNLACLYSLQRQFDKCLEYIILAIQHGYPYIDHILRDKDLLNLFNSPIGSRAKEEINQTFREGFELKINIQNRIFIQYRGRYELVSYTFHNDGTVEKNYRDYNLYRSGTYEIKNWLIIIHWTGGEGDKDNEIDIFPYMEITNQWEIDYVVFEEKAIP